MERNKEEGKWGPHVNSVTLYSCNDIFSTL